MNTSDTEPAAPSRRAVFFGGCVPASLGEEHLAHAIGATLAEHGFTLLHGGYNGLMEHAARGATEQGGTIVALTLDGMAWGPFNPYVTTATYAATMGERMHAYLDTAEVIVAMAGGIGTLHELTAALWYSGNIRQVPVVVAGPTARRLLAFLRAEQWIYPSQTRPLGFLHETDSADDVIAALAAGGVVGRAAC